MAQNSNIVSGCVDHDDDQNGGDHDADDDDDYADQDDDDDDDFVDQDDESMPVVFVSLYISASYLKLDPPPLPSTDTHSNY